MAKRRRYPLVDEGAARAKTEGRTPEFRDVAHRLSETRRLREKALPADVSNSRAWDLLLVLYAEGEMITSHVFKAAGVPHTSGLRWLDRLDELGLAQRRSLPDNFQVALVSLTAEGMELMTDLLTRIAALR
jgi:DNA-binding MarR family transcriptional regulator